MAKRTRAARRHSKSEPSSILPRLDVDFSQVRLNTELTRIISRRPNVRVAFRPRRDNEDHHNPDGADQDLPENEEVYDEIVLCVLADTAKRLLGKNAGLMEKFVLGRTKWSDDVTVTHNVRGSSLDDGLASERWLMKFRTLIISGNGIR